MLSVIIPVLDQIKLTIDLFNCILDNTLLPSQIILIDNGSKEDYSNFQEKYPDLNIEYIRNDKNIGVNPSWNLGISLAKNKYISILNNDIIISNTFFDKIYQVFEQHTNIGIIVPNTLKNIEFGFNNNLEPKAKTLGKREGWAFTIRKEIVDNIDPIPSCLKISCGDDYLFECSKLLGYENVKILNNFIYHYGSATIKLELMNKESSVHLTKKERQHWNEIKKDLQSRIKNNKQRRKV